MSKAAITIYHNPRCSKSRQTLQILEEAGVEPVIVEYLKTPPDARELERLCTALGGDATQMLRFKEDEARALGLKPDDARSRAEWLDILAAHPKLLERPVVVKGARAVIGRPPSMVRELL